MPEDYRNQVVAYDPCRTEQSTEKHGAHRSCSALVNVRQPEENGGDNDCRPDGRSSTDNCRQSKATIEKLFAYTSSYGEGKVGKHFHARLWKDTLREGLQQPPRRRREPDHSAQAEPLENCQRRGTGDSGQNYARFPVDRQ